MHNAKPIERTTVVLPPYLKRRAGEQARREGISFGEFVRRALEHQLAVAAKQTGDPFWDNLVVYDVPGPTEVSEKHDEHLYRLDD